MTRLSIWPVLTGAFLPRLALQLSAPLPLHPSWPEKPSANTGAEAKGDWDERAVLLLPVALPRPHQPRALTTTPKASCPLTFSQSVCSF